MTATFIVRSTCEADWREVRQIRLEMLADTPMAYGETLDSALAHDDDEWRMRARRGESEHGTAVVAVDAGSGRWVATMGGYVDDDAGPMLVGVYVHPDHRGRAAGVTDSLLDAVEEWARGEGDTLTLHVHEDNARAAAYYRRRGFEATGRTLPYNLDPTRLEVEMRRVLRDSPPSRT